MVKIHYTSPTHALRAEFQSQSSARAYLRQTMLHSAALLFTAAELRDGVGTLLCEFRLTADGVINILENPPQSKINPQNAPKTQKACEDINHAKKPLKIA